MQLEMTYLGLTRTVFLDRLLVEAKAVTVQNVIHTIPLQTKLPKVCAISHVSFICSFIASQLM